MMNSHVARAALLGLACAALLAGCAGKTSTVSYYSLHVPTASAAVGALVAAPAAALSGLR